MEFLCERGADVNRGLRSSSLHYAACFGRPQIVKVCCRFIALAVLKCNVFSDKNSKILCLIMFACKGCELGSIFLKCVCV